MSQPTEIFDRSLHRIHRQRAFDGFDAHGFLFREIAARMTERLDDVSRRFAAPLILGGRAPAPDLPQAVKMDLYQGFCRNGVVGDEERLPFRDQSFDLVFSPLSLHWVNDLPGALIQLRRALRPDGLLLAAMFGGGTLFELRQALMTAELELEDGASPRVSPFVELRDAGGLLQRAGLALPVADMDTVTVTYAHPLKLLADLRGMGEQNAIRARRRTFMRRATLLRAMEIYQEQFAQADGRVTATFEVIYLTGWAPHESQQQPLRPGQATSRLADALGSVEKGAGEKPGE